MSGSMSQKQLRDSITTSCTTSLGARCASAGTAEMRGMLLAAASLGNVAEIRVLLLHVLARGDAAEALMPTYKLDWRSVLHLAAAEGHLDVVQEVRTRVSHHDCMWRELLMRSDILRFSCLHLAACRGQVEVVKVLMEAGGRELLMMTDMMGSSCLHQAAMFLSPSHAVQMAELHTQHTARHL